MDPYDTLNVRNDATNVEINQAYKKLLEKYDLANYAGDPTFAKQRVEKIKNAYSILSDSKKKAEYDKAHEIHVKSHESKKDSFTPYYKKEYSYKHIHDDDEIAQEKYKAFQKYNSKIDNSLDGSNYIAESSTVIKVFIFIFCVIMLCSMFPFIISFLIFW